MNVSAKLEYACIAVLELASHWGEGEPLRIRDIAETHGVPARFLVQILLQLKSAGIVQSERGSTGGYLLARPPHQVTLADVKGVIEGSSHEGMSELTRPTPAVRILHGVWNDVAQAEQRMLADVTFAELADQVRIQPEEMYYI